MKNFATIVLVFLTLLFMYSCKDDVVGGGGIGPGGGGNITFAVSGQVDPSNPNNYIFGFKPSVDAKLTSIVLGVPAQPFFDTLSNGNPNYVFSKDTIYTLTPYTGVQTGQAWTFKFAGNLISNNQAYTVTINHTIP